jgi:hypothetical protein
MAAFVGGGCVGGVIDGDRVVLGDFRCGVTDSGARQACTATLVIFVASKIDRCEGDLVVFQQSPCRLMVAIFWVERTEFGLVGGTASGVWSPAEAGLVPRHSSTSMPVLRQARARLRTWVAQGFDELALADSATGVHEVPALPPPSPPRGAEEGVDLVEGFGHALLEPHLDRLFH